MPGRKLEEKKSINLDDIDDILNEVDKKDD